MTKKEARYYLYFDERGKERFRKVTYSLVFDGDILVNVFNEYNFSVEKTSECWDYFNSKYNK